MDHVHHIAQRQTVDHIADAARKDHGDRGKEQKIAILGQAEKRKHRHDRDARDDQEYPTPIGKHPPGRTAVLDIGDMKDPLPYGDAVIKRHVG